MKMRQIAKGIGTIALLGAIVLALSSISHRKAETEEITGQHRIESRAGPVEYDGKNPELLDTEVTLST